MSAVEIVNIAIQGRIKLNEARDAAQQALEACPADQHSNVANWREVINALDRAETKVFVAQERLKRLASNGQ